MRSRDWISDVCSSDLVRGPGLRVLSRILLSLLVLFAVAARPAMAQSILRDAETEALLQDMMDPLTVAAGMRAGQVRVHLLSDRSINAFVAGSQDIYVHSGLIEAADSANEVQGVRAHELGHIRGGHAIRDRKSVGWGKSGSVRVNRGGARS